MRYNRLGDTGLLVSELCLGTMTFGGVGGVWQSFGALGQDEADRLVGCAVEAGINLFDTADGYAGGESERMLGVALRRLKLPRDAFVVATKVFGPTGTGPNSCGASRAHIMEAMKGSLERLGLDHIDLYQIHGFDAVTPIEETVRALDTLVHQGLVRYVGVSNWAAWQVMKALGLAERNGLARLATLQAYYSLVGRDIERELIPLLQTERVGLLVWSPLAGGLLSGKYAAADAGAGGRRSSFDFPPVDGERARAVLTVLRPMAEARGVSLARIAIAWLLHQPPVTSVILGARHEKQLRDTIAAAETVLSPDELAQLAAASRLAPEYPGWMFEFLGQYRAASLARAPRGADAG